MIKNNIYIIYTMINKNIQAIYVFLFALGITGAIGLILTLFFNVKINRGSEWISYTLILIPILFTLFLIFINENEKLKQTSQSLNFVQKINNIIYLLKEVIKNSGVGIFIIMEIIIALVLAIDHIDYYWMGTMSPQLRLLHILIVILLIHQIYKYNKYVYKLLFDLENKNPLTNKFIIEMVASISLCITAISGVYVYFTKFKTSDADVIENKIL
jgi:hypothetical protein